MKLAFTRNGVRALRDLSDGLLTVCQAAELDRESLQLLFRSYSDSLGDHQEVIMNMQEGLYRKTEDMFMMILNLVKDLRQKADEIEAFLNRTGG